MKQFRIILKTGTTLEILARTVLEALEKSEFDLEEINDIVRVS